jgi:hypothetical protein
MQPFHLKHIWEKRRTPKEETHEDSSSSNPDHVEMLPLPSWEDMFPHGLEMMRYVEQRKKGACPCNPYMYNLRGSIPKTPIGAFPLKPMVHPNEIGEKITKLEQVSKACVETVGEGVDAYWMMSKDLEKNVDDINGRVELLVNLVLEMT